MAEIKWEILDRYLAGEASEEESATAEQWLSEHESFRILLAALKHSDVVDLAARRAQVEVWARLQDDMSRPRESAPASRQPLQLLLPPTGVRAFSRRLPVALKAAAVLVLVFGGSLIVWRTTKSPKGPSADATLGTIAAAIGLPPVSVSLPDGSRAIVSPGSTLRYAATFGMDRREVQLEGEAYFAVKHDATRPFLVRAGDLVARDRGTAFVVRAYPEDRHGQVVVQEGLVGIADTMVRPGQLGRLGDNGEAIVQAADTSSWFAWTHGRLSLTGLTLREALPKLHRWYGLEFRLADPSLGDRKMQGVLSSNIDEAIQTLDEFTPWLHLTREGRVITFHAVSVNPS